MVRDVVEDGRREVLDATLDVLGEVGLERMTLEAVGERLGRSRASMYREHGTLAVLLGRVHEVGLRWLSRGFGLVRVGSPRAQLEAVFAELRAFARTPRGQAFRALRARVASLRDLEDFRRREAEGLVAVRQWLETLVDHSRSRPDLVTELTAVLWSRALGPGPWDPGPPTADELELTWQLLAPHFSVTELPREPIEPDFELTGLSPLLSA